GRGHSPTGSQCKVQWRALGLIVGSAPLRTSGCTAKLLYTAASPALVCRADHRAPADVGHPIWICWRTWVTQGSPQPWPIDPVMLVCSTRHNSAPSLLSAREKCAVATA